MRRHVVNLVIINVGRTEEGVPSCSWEPRRLPRSCGPGQGPQVGIVLQCGLGWEEPGKMLSSRGCGEGEGPGGGPVERRVTKRPGVTGTTLPYRPEGPGLGPEGTRSHGRTEQARDGGQTSAVPSTG